jgi:phage host-nuclease inhibitor protein Gam
MSTRRIKPANLTRDDAERPVGEISAATNRQREINAEIDTAIIAARKAHESELSDLSEAIKEKSNLVQAWADDNHGEFGNRKSIELAHGVIGYRMGTPKVKTLAGFTFDRVLEKIAELHLVQWIRTKKEVDKEQILNDHARGEIAPGTLRDVGVKIVQDETFFIEPKLTETETRVTAAA